VATVGRKRQDLGLELALSSYQRSSRLTAKAWRRPWMRRMPARTCSVQPRRCLILLNIFSRAAGVSGACSAAPSARRRRGRARAQPRVLAPQAPQRLAGQPQPRSTCPEGNRPFRVRAASARRDRSQAEPPTARNARLQDASS
jgi:hypothetical protein